MVFWPAIVVATTVASSELGVQVGQGGPWSVARYSTDGKMLRRFTGFERISDIALDDSSELLVAEQERSRISALDSDGHVVWHVSAPQPRCVQALPSGHLLVCRDDPADVVEIDRRGKWLWNLGADLPDVSGAARLADGNTAVVVGKPPFAVHIFNPDGRIVWSGTSQLRQPRSLAVLPSGELATSGFDYPLLVLFGPYGEAVRTLDFCCHAESASSIPGGGLVSVSSERQVVQAWSSSGEKAWRFETLYPPFDAEMATDGTLWVSLFEPPDRECMNARRAADRPQRPLAPYWRWSIVGASVALLITFGLRHRELGGGNDQHAAGVSGTGSVSSLPGRRRVEIALLVTLVVLLAIAAAVYHAYTNRPRSWPYAALIIPAGLGLARLRARLPPDARNLPVRLQHLDAMAAPSPRMWVLWTAGIILVIRAFVGVYQESGDWVAGAWVAGLVLLAGGALERRRKRTASGTRSVASIVCGLLAVSALLAMRLYRLEDIPMEVHGDSAQAAMQAIRLVDGDESGIFQNAVGEIPMAGFLWRAGWVALAGHSVAGVRFPSAVGGALAILGAFFIVRRLFGTTAALITAALLAFDKTLFHFSRIPSTYVDPVPFHLTAILGLIAGLESGRYGWFALAGLAAGYGSLTYHAGRIIPPLVTLLTVVLLFGFPHAIRKRWPGILLGAVTFLAVVGPQALVYGTQRANAFGRIEQFPWMNAGSVNTGALVETITHGVPRAFGSFWDVTDSSTQYGGKVAFFPPIAALLAIGAVAALARPFSVIEIFVLLWGTTIIFVGGALTREPPFWPRLVMSLIPAMIIVGQAVASLIEGATIATGGRRARLVVGLVVMVLLCANAAAELNAYRRYALGMPAREDRPTQPNASPQTIMGRDVQRWGGRAAVYIVARNPLKDSCDTPAMRYFAADTDTRDARDIARYIPFSESRPVVVYVTPQSNEAIATLLSAYPGAERRDFQNNLGVQAFTRFVIPPVNPPNRP